MSALILPADPNVLRQLASAIEAAQNSADFAALVDPKRDNSMQISWRSRPDDLRADAFATALITAIDANWTLLVGQALATVQSNLDAITSLSASQAIPVATTNVVTGP